MKAQSQELTDEELSIPLAAPLDLVWPLFLFVAALGGIVYTVVEAGGTQRNQMIVTAPAAAFMIAWGGLFLLRWHRNRKRVLSASNRGLRIISEGSEERVLGWEEVGRVEAPTFIQLFSFCRAVLLDVEGRFVAELPFDANPAVTLVLDRALSATGQESLYMVRPLSTKVAAVLILVGITFAIWSGVIVWQFTQGTRGAEDGYLFAIAVLGGLFGMSSIVIGVAQLWLRKRP